MIKKGSEIPNVIVHSMSLNGLEAIHTNDLFATGKVLLFGVPGAFTPTCSQQHVPGYLKHASVFASKGIHKIYCMSVNDAFVMDAWGKDQNVGKNIMMLADGVGAFTNALGLELDLTKAGLGKRCMRFAMVIENGIISHIAVEEGNEFKVSSAESILEVL